MNSEVLFEACNAFIRGELRDSRGWLHLVSEAESGTSLGIAVTLRLIHDINNPYALGAIAAEPLWELLESQSAEVGTALANAAMTHSNLCACLHAIDRYSRKVLALQRTISSGIDCDPPPPPTLRRMAQQDIIERVCAENMSDGSIRIENVWRELHSLGNGRAAIENCLNRLMDGEPPQVIAEEVDRILLQHDGATDVIDAVAIASQSTLVRCCLSYCVWFGLGESAIDAFLAAFLSLKPDLP